MALGSPIGESTVFPVPYGGWNAVSELRSMEITDAIKLQNIFPGRGEVSLRKGYRVHVSDPETLGTGPIKTLVELSTAAGEKKLVACADLKVFDVTAFGATPTDITGSATITNDYWQTLNVKGVSGGTVLILVNGSDTPLQWTASGNVSTISYTGISDPSKLIGLTSFRNRIYFIEKNSTSFWYTNTVNGLSGQLNPFDVGHLLTQGGYLTNITAWGETGLYSNDHLMVISNMGEGLVFAGLAPNIEGWSLVTRFKISPPLGYRAFVTLGRDIIVLTIDGYTVVGESLFGQQQSVYSPSISKKINPAISDITKTRAAYEGWQGIVYPRGGQLLVNIPIVPDALAQQHVMNTDTAAWCEFTGLNASCFCVHKDGLYFGGNDGIIYEADYAAGSLTSDAGKAISASLRTAFNYAGDENSIKQWLLVCPIIRANAGFGFGVGVDTDYQSKTKLSPTMITGSSATPWGSPWGSSWGAGFESYLNYYAIAGLGRCASVIIEGEFKNIGWSMSAMNVNYIRGGIL